MAQQLIADIREYAYARLDYDPAWLAVAVWAEGVEAGVSQEASPRLPSPEVPFSLPHWPAVVPPDASQKRQMGQV